MRVREGTALRSPEPAAEPRPSCPGASPGPDAGACALETAREAWACRAAVMGEYGLRQKSMRLRTQQQAGYLPLKLLLHGTLPHAGFENQDGDRIHQPRDAVECSMDAVAPVPKGLSR